MRALFPLLAVSSFCASGLHADSLSLAASRVLIPERLGSGAAIVTITLDHVPAADVEVTIANTNLTLLSVPAHLTIPAGSASASFTVDAVSDPAFRENETVTLAVSHATYGSAQSRRGPPPHRLD